MRLGIWELLIIFGVILILFGAKRLPEIGQALGKAIREFKKAGQDLGDDSKEKTKEDHGEDKA
ncbi:MAG: twin-arginine translocase TatA/TatE family subunit [Candidatus Omnitrophota bacterium]